MFSKIIATLSALVTSFVMLFIPASQPGELPETSMPVVNVNPNPIAKAETYQDVTVMSYNVYIRGDNLRAPDVRAEYITTNIKNHMPDSFGVQEADKAWTDRLEAALPEYARTGAYRDDGKEAGESSSVFYLKDKYNLVESGDFWLSETPDKPSLGWDAACNRICTYAVLENKETGFRYVHFNAHFDHVGNQAMAESVALLSNKIADLYPDLPVVVTGDFNFPEGSANYQNVLKSGLRDTKFLAETSDSGATYHGYQLIVATDKPIDYILVNDYASAVESYTIDRTLYNLTYSSDHHPVISKITLFNGGKN